MASDLPQLVTCDIVDMVMFLVAASTDLNAPVIAVSSLGPRQVSAYSPGSSFQLVPMVPGKLDEDEHLPSPSLGEDG